jgi:hypothetical protein
METIFVFTHIVIIICIGIIFISITSKNSAERYLKNSVSPVSNLKPTQSTPNTYYRRVTSYLSVLQNEILIILNINNPKT